jgi:signal transduction histidine kinase
VTASATPSGSQSPGVLLRASPPSLTPWLWRDRVLLNAFLIGGLLISYQLVLTLLHPPWIGPVTDWLRAALAWPELAVVVGVSLWLTRTRRADARAWWMGSVALLSYTVARTVWTVDDQVIFHHGVPFPTFPDLFFVLQYPFFFLALILLPYVPPWGPRVKLILDCLLWTGTAAALSWYFILAPLYMAPWASPLGKVVSLAYPVGDLFLLFGLVLALLRQSRYEAERLTLYVVCLALVCLITADAWVATLILMNRQHVYLTGHPPDLFWLAFYLLVPLAALVRLRLAYHEPLPPHRPVSTRTPQQLERQDLLASLRFLSPFVAALLASAVILIRATFVSAYADHRRLIAPFAVSFGLLLLVLARQEFTFLENARLRREWEGAQLEALAMREATRRMQEFLSIASHELKTPLTSLKGNLQLLTRRLRRVRLEEGGRVEDLAGIVAMVQSVAERLEHSLRRLARLVDDLLDESRIAADRLEFRLALVDLSVTVREAVAEQRLLAGTRTIQLELPGDAQPVRVIADADRIEQVVTNYLTNALKYSQEDRPVAVCLQVDGETARVAVRDEGVGVPPAEQAAIWGRFHRAAGVTIQSGSDIGIGIGLHISRTIIEGHHGQVGVESAVGQGSTFWFTLPLAQARATPSQLDERARLGA